MLAEKGADPCVKTKVRELIISVLDYFIVHSLIHSPLLHGLGWVDSVNVGE